jgi:flagellar hook protein FlgE
MDTMSIGISGLNAATLGVSVTANDIANVNSQGYKAKRVDLAEAGGGGVTASQVTTSEAEGTPGGSNVDMATEMTDLLAYSDLYKVNAKVLEVQKEVLGTVMDMTA